MNVAEATIDIRMAFIRKVYAILTVQIAATAIFSSVSFFNVAFKTWIQSHAWMMYASIFGSIVFLVRSPHIPLGGRDLILAHVY